MKGVYDLCPFIFGEIGNMAASHAGTKRTIQRGELQSHLWPPVIKYGFCTRKMHRLTKSLARLFSGLKPTKSKQRHDFRVLGSI
jgi:hypothetical protein